MQWLNLRDIEWVNRDVYIVVIESLQDPNQKWKYCGGHKCLTLQKIEHKIGALLNLIGQKVLIFFYKSNTINN